MRRTPNVCAVFRATLYCAIVIENIRTTLSATQRFVCCTRRLVAAAIATRDTQAIVALEHCIIQATSAAQTTMFGASTVARRAGANTASCASLRVAVALVWR